jgi:S-DNA-T family DNA segregation ATPase FtsK/SpoIIIE
MTPAPVPTLEIVGPCGRPVVVAPCGADDRVGDLADCLGIPAEAPLQLDGRHVARHETLARAGVVRGSSLDVASSHTGVSAAAAGAVVVCDAGPAAGIRTALAPGRHVVGRSPGAAVHFDDPGVEAHHALLDVAVDGTVAVAQLTGRVPCRVDGEPIGSGAVVPPGGVVTMGSSRLRVTAHPLPGVAAAVLAAVPGDPWRRAVRRTPRPLPRWAPDPIPVPPLPPPAAPPGPAGVVAAALAAGGAAVVAVVLRSPLFLVFASVGLLASGGVWLVSWATSGRAARRHRARHAADVASFAAALDEQRAARRAHHDATTGGIEDAITAATSVRADVWCRRTGHDDVHRASLGRGSVEWPVALTAVASQPLAPELSALVRERARFADAAVPVELGPGAALAIGGRGAPAVARALVVQLATWTGPADLRLVVVAADPVAWDWCRWLPHAAGPDGPRVVPADDADRVAAVLGALDDGSARHALVVTDRVDLLSQRTGPLRRFLGAAPSAAVVAVVGPEGATPAMCRSVLEIGSLGMARWWADASVDAHPTAVHVAGVTVAAAARAARSLAALVDPEEAAGPGPVLGTGAGLAALTAQHGPGPIDDPIAIAAGWRAAGPDPAPVAIVGATADGVVEVDLARDGPHVLVAGTTGSGKSELLRTLVVSLASRCGPDHLTFVLVDYKGGATFDACADLPHTVGLVTDLDAELAARALTSLDAEVRRREHLLRATGAADLTAHRARGGDPLARLVVVVDEFAALVADLPDFLRSLVGIAQRGRSLGVHLVLATQRPAGVVSDDIRANTNLRIALRLHDVADARDVVGADAPVAFPRGTPGRAMLRLGPGEHVVFQTARSSGPVEPTGDERLHVVEAAAVGPAGDSALTVLVHTIRNAAALAEVAAPHRPWLPPLPAHVAAGDLAAVGPVAGVVGLVDDPAGQCRRPLRWEPADGNLAIVGAAGCGTTTALCSVLRAVAATHDPGACHVYVVDACGDERLDELTALDHCGAVVRPHQRERLSRLLRRLAATLDDRRSGGGAGAPAVVLAIDGLAPLRTLLDDPLDHDDLDRLARVLAEGPSVGIVSVLTAERPGALPAAVLATCGHHWVGRLADPGERALCGLPATAPPAGPPGRFVVAATGSAPHLAQLVELPAGVAARGAGGPPPVDVLPPIVTTATRGVVTADGDVTLVIGIDFETLGDATLRVPDGEHVLVAGPARSGRSTALATLAASWRAACPAGVVRAVVPRGRVAWPAGEVDTLAGALASLADLAPGTRVLLVVDDAERVDDPHVGPLAAERRPGLLIAAAGRPDALRTLYGHWTGVVRRSRLGVLLAAGADVDGDVLGELLPRHPPIPPRPGLAWLVDARGRRLGQLSRSAGGRPA